MQVKENGSMTVFHILWAPLKIHSTYGSKGTLPCFLQLMSKVRPRLDHLGLLSPAVLIDHVYAEEYLDPKTLIYTWGGLFQAR